MGHSRGGSDKRLARLGIVLISVMIMLPERSHSSPPDSSKVAFVAEADVNSRYVWHGIAFSEGAVFQPSAGVSALGFDLSLWGNMPLHEQIHQGKFDEVDVVLARSFTIDKLALDTSFEYYMYPHQAENPDTGEGFLELSWPFGLFTPYTKHSVDIVRYDGAYFGEAGLRFEKDWNSKLSLRITPYFGWAAKHFNEVYLGVSKNAWNLLGAEAALSWHVRDAFQISPYVKTTALQDKELRSAVEKPNFTVFGVKISGEF